MSEVIQIDSSHTRVALGKFRASLAEKGELMRQIGLLMLKSIYQTFRDEGSPQGSWPRLAPSTVAKDAKYYGAGHKLLIGRGTLRNSIHAANTENETTIGTNLIYAAVHQFGSRDRGSVFGPRTAAMEAATAKVKAHTRTRLSSGLGVGRMSILNKMGRQQMLRRRIAGPRNQRVESVSAHTRHQNIPARPYVVFRPEDPGRIEGLVSAWVKSKVHAAGLEPGR
jgi:phage virion morphogenesis protein